MRNSLLILIILCCFGCKKPTETPEVIILHNNWSFKNVKDTKWLNATVPGSVHTDLLDQNIIKHPFIGANELYAGWISDNDWEYKTSFKIDKKILQKDHQELHFEGLDTYANVYLNDSLILNTNNAFRSWTVDVKSVLKTDNELRVVFSNTKSYEEKKKAKLTYELPEGNRIFTRKAQFQYGWDWGPKLNTSGIWRSVYIKVWETITIKDVFVEQLTLNDSIAILEANLNIETDTDDDLTVDIYVNDNLNSTHSYQKENTSGFSFQIQNPKKWWPHNIGEPYLYDLKFVIKQGKTVLDTYKLKKGLRTIDLITESDTKGQTFYFKVNNVPVYMKGANYIPQNSFQNLVTDSHYDKLLNDAVVANMNMLRVWGGGIYENDIFYELCDEKGILVWQDFMFACAMYPGDEAFLKNVHQEAIDNVKRLRNHASIALWCGNNENSEGWHRWGWQSGRSEAEKEEIWANYLKVFDSILPNTVKQLTDNTPYWESSPKYGRGNPRYEFEGDAHDWWIWHDAYPFEHLDAHVPRFMSEFGFQSFPGYEAIKYINQSDSISIQSKGFKTHQKHHRGFKLIREYMERDFPVPEADEDYVYMSQVLQAYGITKGIEAHRRAKPYNMGSLYWQLNDCWPVVSWSSIDHLGNWKALHYRAKKVFDNLLISPVIENGTLKVYVVNDNMTGMEGQFVMNINSFNGKTIYGEVSPAKVSGNSSSVLFEFDLNEADFNKEEVYATFKFSGKHGLFYFSKPKDLKLSKDNIDISVSKTVSGFDITLYAETLQKDVFLYTNEEGFFSDNYFDLMPGETVIIHFKTNAEALGYLNIKRLNDFTD